MSDDTVRPQDEVELNAKEGKIRVRGSDILGISTLVGVCVFGYILWDHKDAAAKEAMITRLEFVAAIKEMTAINKEGVTAQRVMNCLQTLDQKDRQQQLATCERLAK